MSQWEQCLVDESNQSASALASGMSYSFRLQDCVDTVAGPGIYGTSACTAIWTIYYSDGTPPGQFSQNRISAEQCPTDSLFKDPEPYGNPRCERIGDIFETLPPIKDTCHCGDPIYPLTGARRQDEDLGIKLAGQPVRLTYDTTPLLPVAQGLINLTLSPAPSFGLLWQSSLHKSIAVESGGGPPEGSYGSVVMLRGPLGLASAAADNKNTCANGGDGSQSGNTNAMVSAVDPGLKLSFASNSATSPSTLLDASALVEESYDGTGAIANTSYAAGGWLSYTYSTGVVAGVSPTAGLLISVTDHVGRTVQFTYEQPSTALLPRIKTVTAPDGTVIQAGYDASNNLVTLTWPDSAVRTYRYERGDVPWALTGITDEANRDYSTYGYDGVGRAIATHLGASANSYSVTYSSPPMWGVTETDNGTLICRDHHWVAPQGTTVTDPIGNARAFGATTAHGMTMLASTTSPAGSGSSASGTHATYDANGNVTSSDDLNGNRSCYSYDLTRNLQIGALDGLPGGTSGKTCPASLANYVPSPVDAAHPERKTTTMWHSDWALKAQEAEPKKITTWVYNGQPDPIAGTTANCVTPATTLPDGKPLAVLCTRYEQATTDATGALGLSATVSGATRAWTYTYNQYGQVLAETTPKQSSTDTLSHTTTYTYYATTSFSGAAGYTVGDLQTITNPLGQVTTFTSYDKAGRLLSSTDANGTVTTQTYFPRGWLHTQTVTSASGAALTTTYAYWPTGLLKLVTMPDASTLSYTYDDAHRLTDVVDGAGNKVHYVLDNVGNRTSEQVSDASGQLVSTVTRVYDALNRVQSTTGAIH